MIWLPVKFQSRLRLLCLELPFQPATSSIQQLFRTLPSSYKTLHLQGTPCYFKPPYNHLDIHQQDLARYPRPSASRSRVNHPILPFQPSSPNQSRSHLHSKQNQSPPRNVWTTRPISRLHHRQPEEGQARSSSSPCSTRQALRCHCPRRRCQENHQTSQISREGRHCRYIRTYS